MELPASERLAPSRFGSPRFTSEQRKGLKPRLEVIAAFREEVRDMERNGTSTASVMWYAGQEAIRLGHPYIGTEHQLFGILRMEDPEVAALLAQAGTTADEVRTRLEESLPAGTPGSVDPDAPLPYTSRAKKVMSFAAAVQEDEKSEALRVFEALLKEEHNVAAQVLGSLGIRATP